RAADARLDVLEGDVPGARRAEGLEVRGEAVEVALVHRVDGHDAVFDAEVVGEGRRIVEAVLRGEARRHGDAEHLRRTQRARRDDRRDGAVDTARQTEQSALKAALRRVVADAEGEGVDGRRFVRLGDGVH